MVQKHDIYLSRDRVGELMEYIIRKAAIKAVDDLPNCYNGFSDTYDKACIIGVLEELPPADVAPVRHGRWEKATGMMPPEYCGLHICSECGHYAGRKPPYGGKEMLSDYCPNCGALMDKDGDSK